MCIEDDKEREERETKVPVQRFHNILQLAEAKLKFLKKL
jgi:hypothetical protein